MPAPENNIDLLKKFMDPRKDSLQNLLTGMGVPGKDSRLGAVYKYTLPSSKFLETFHDSSDIAKTVVNKIPELATKKWITHIIERDDTTEETVEKLIREDERLKLQDKTKKAMAWARLYGGSVFFLVVDDGLPLEEPIDKKRISRIKSIVVLHRYEISNDGQICEDIASSNFGLPDYYSISGRTNTVIPRIHHSRFIRFEGSPISEDGFRANDYWNDSHLNLLHDVARDYEDAYNGIARALKDFDVEILKLKDLASLVGGKQEDTIRARLDLMQLSKSVISTIAIDSDGEDFQRLQRQFGGVGEMLDKLDKRMQSITGIPHTVLFGEGSTGVLGAGGESEQTTLHDLISIEQKNQMQEQLSRMFDLIQLQKQGPTNGELIPEHKFIFNPLNEPTEKQQAEYRNLIAQTDQAYHSMGVLTSDEIAKSRFGPYGFSAETQIDQDAREQQEDLDKMNPQEGMNALQPQEKPSPGSPKGFKKQQRKNSTFVRA